MRLLTGLAAERGLRIVVVLHDLNVAARYADDVVAMREGRVVAQGAVEQVITVEQLTDLYDTPAHVVEVEGRRVVLWQ
jgi:iron complex transport system ATP-binding protein